MLFALILLVLGAFVIYVGRTRDKWIVYAGGITFAVGVLLLVLWLIDRSDADLDTARAFLAVR